MNSIERDNTDFRIVLRLARVATVVNEIEMAHSDPKFTQLMSELTPVSKGNQQIQDKINTT